MKKNQAYIYAKSCIKAKEVPKYVKKQCKELPNFAQNLIRLDIYIPHHIFQSADRIFK